MIYRRYFAIIFVILFIFLLLPAQPAAAANEDFEVEYEFFPEVVPYKGGNIQLTLTVRNTGPTNITWIDIIVNTAASFSQRWTGTITPGSTRTFSVFVPFEQADLNVVKLLQVSMNNNTTANPDGVKTFRFELEGVEQFIDREITKAPDREAYNVGDTIQITHVFTNTITTHAAISAQTRMYIRVNGEVHSTSSSMSQGNIFPGASVSHVTNLTLDETYVGEVNITSNIQFTMLDKEYSFSESYTTFIVASPEPDIDFTTVLYATPAEIEAGDPVMFHVQIENRGDEVDKFEIRNSEGGLIACTGSFAPGEAQPVLIEFNISEASDVSFVVIGYAGDYYESQETNTVHITIAEPLSIETATATPTPCPTPEPTPVPSPTEEAPSHATSTSSSISAISPSVAPSETDPPEDSADTQEGLSFGAFSLIVLAALIIAAIIILSVILIKRRKGKNVKDSDFE